MYIRDKRSPTPKSEAVSRVMSANRSKNTKPEMLLRRSLWRANLRGYRLHYKRVPGRPDISYVSKKVAIFVHGCFWHRCPKCNYPLPKTNTQFWQTKFDSNVERDRRKKADLTRLGWKVVTVWECDLKYRLDLTLRKIQNSLR
ncbi:MAG: very short patch repair endonuclease [Acidobacteria bacterium]|nr:very short patch repair endonuclease [Acidobacteriota bacterium]